MILITIGAFVAGAIGGAIAAYFFIKNNPAKVAVANAVVSAVDNGASAVLTAAQSAVKKL